MDNPGTSTPDPQRQGPAWTVFALYVLGALAAFLGATVALGAIVPLDSPLLPLALGVASLTIFGGIAGVYGLRPSSSRLADWGLQPLRWRWRWLPGAVGISVLFMPMRAALGLVFELLLSGDLDSLLARSDLLGPGETFASFAYSLVGISILVPIAEELFFRGVLHTWLQRQQVPLVTRTLISSGVFAIFHIDSLGVLASSFILGVIAALVYERTRSLLTPILVHVTTNGFAVVLLYTSVWLTEWLALT